MGSTTPHTRSVPTEWAELTAYAEHIVPAQLAPEGHFKRRHLSGLLRRVNKLDNERLETNYYYALGEAMCGMANMLRDERARQTIVRGGMLETALWRRGGAVPLGEPFVPLVGDLLPLAMEKPFFEAASLSVRTLPPAPRALADTLAGATLCRRRVDDFAALPQLFRHIIAVEEIRTADLAGHHIGRNFLAGAVSVFNVLLTGTNPSEGGPTDEMLASPIEPEAVERIRHSKDFIIAARLREDEFRHGAGWEGRGESLRFNAKIFRETPPPLEVVEGMSLHQKRLMCPAVQADGLAREVARHILPSIIMTARELIPGELFL